MRAPNQTASLDQLANFLVDGYWGSARSFDTSNSTTIDVNLTELGADGRALARAALESWEMVADIDFREVSGTGDITFQDSARGASVSSTLIGSDVQSAVVNVGVDRLERYGTTLDSYAFQTYVHEIGHALGLGHMGSYDGGADYDTDATFRNDSWSVSVMSYFNQNENSFDSASYARVSTAMIADIAAIQTLYGAAGTNSVTAGNTVYGAGSTLDNYLGDMFRAIAANDTNALYAGGAMSYTIWDTDGIDTINYSFTGSNNVIRLAEQASSDVDGGVGNLTIARGTVIENAFSGWGNDTVLGNQADNVIRAGGGNDVVGGYAGNDLIFGDNGNDTLYGGTGSDTVYGGNGHDQIWTSDGGNLGLAGDGNDILGGGNGADTLYGGLGDDTAFAGNGNDIVGGFDGDDELYGGNGDDTVYGGNGNDTAAGGFGNDVIYTSPGDDSVYGGFGDDTMGAGTGNDNIIAGAGADIVYAGAGNDNVDGGDGNDTIYASTGADELIGGAGDDTFWFNAGNDRIMDFETGADRINLALVSSITSFADLMADHISDIGAGALVSVGNGDTLILDGISSDSLNAEDFIF